MTASQIIDLLGGTSAVAHAIGVAPSTVHSWRKQLHIPRWWQQDLLALAMEKQVPLAGTDFPAKPERQAA